MTLRRRARRDLATPPTAAAHALQPRPLAVTPHRRYVLGQIAAGRVTWDSRLGYRLDGSACAKTLRELVGAGWATEGDSHGRRYIELTDDGRAIVTNETP